MSVKEVDLGIRHLTVYEAAEVMVKVREIEQRYSKRLIFAEIKGLERLSTDEAAKIVKRIFPVKGKEKANVSIVIGLEKTESPYEHFKVVHPIQINCANKNIFEPPCHNMETKDCCVVKACNCCTNENACTFIEVNLQEGGKNAE